jgi:sulfur carrier protein
MKITVNGEPREVAAGTTVHEVVVGQGESEPRRGTAVAVDGSVVPRARLVETTLSEGSRVEIVTAVQGG